jgi:hypothetical protein
MIRSDLNVGDLIKDLKEAYGKPVSILVDNYDLPLLNDDLSPRLRRQIISILAKFYEQIRANVDNVRLGLAIGEDYRIFRIFWRALKRCWRIQVKPQLRKTNNIQV